MLDKLFPEDEILVLNKKGAVIHRFPEGTPDWRPILLGKLVDLSKRFPELDPEKLNWTTVSRRAEGIPPKPLL